MSASANSSDAKIDSFYLNAGNCDAPSITDVLYSNAASIARLPFVCIFNDVNTTLSSDCGFTQDENEHFDWTEHSQATPTLETGPTGVDGFGNFSQTLHLSVFTVLLYILWF